MAIIIRNLENRGSNETFNLNLIIDILVVILIAILLYVYGLPVLQNMLTDTSTSVRI